MKKAFLATFFLVVFAGYGALPAVASIDYQQMSSIGLVREALQKSPIYFHAANQTLYIAARNPLYVTELEVLQEQVGEISQTELLRSVMSLNRSNLLQKVRRVVISSTGGELLFFHALVSMLGLGDKDSSSKVQVIVPNGEECTSSCTYLLFAASQRHIGKEAKILIHKQRVAGSEECYKDPLTCDQRMQRFFHADSELLQRYREAVLRWLPPETGKPFDSYLDIELRDTHVHAYGLNTVPAESLTAY